MSKGPRSPVKKLSDCINQFLKDEEVRIIGRITRLCVQGKQVYPSAGEDTENEPVKKKNRAYVIIPVKNRDACVEFIKIPICKAEKGVKAKNIGSIKIQRFKNDGCEVTERVPLCVAEKASIPMFDRMRFQKGGTNSVEFVYKRDQPPPPKQESSKKFRCRRKTKGTPPKDKKKDKPKRKKSRTSEKDVC